MHPSYPRACVVCTFANPISLSLNSLHVYFSVSTTSAAESLRSRWQVVLELEGTIKTG